MAALSTMDRAHALRPVNLMVLAGVAALYVWLVFVPDPSFAWAATDEACCHTRTIRAIKDEGILAALGDSRRYRSATTPLYHLLMSMPLDRVDPLAIRYGWTVITLFAGYLMYRQVADDAALHRGTGAALALTLAFVLSPTVRAAARYFVTDGLALYLTVAGLVLVQRGRARAPAPACLCTCRGRLGCCGSARARDPAFPRRSDWRRSWSRLRASIPA